ncbi:hypothetical protein ACFYSC_16490 [Streptosporangium sp. NPDC004379]|uniref:hypothetical protein n=1 Tax=Streptosporangium sp. NPDC004379 TaxID=3366189 RepID=UPI0036806122
MTIDELVRRTLRDWSEEARDPADLASRALGRRRRSRVRTFAVVAGATAAVVAGAFAVPGLVAGGVPGPDGTEPAVAVATGSDPSTAPDPSAGTRETLGDADSATPETLVAAGDTAVYAYYTWRNEKVVGNREARRLTWYLHDGDSGTYEKTPWAWLDPAPGGESAAVLESIPANRVGVVTVRGGEVRWFDLEHPAGALSWSPDGTRLLVTNYDDDPDQVEVTGKDSWNVVPATRTGFTLIDPAAGRQDFRPIAAGDSGSVSRRDFFWNADGTLIWEWNNGAPSDGGPDRNPRKFYGPDGAPRSVPPDDSVGRGQRQQAGLSPGGRWLASDSPDRTAVTALKDMRTGEVRPLKPIDGYWIEQLAAWADDEHVIAWACELKGTDGCVKSEFRNRLLLVDVQGGAVVPLTGYRENSQRPGAWVPVFSRR